MGATPRIFEHYEQSDATDRVVEGNYISITNDDGSNSMSFNLTSKKTGGAVFASAVSVLAGETYSAFVERFTYITITNASTCSIRIDVGV